MKEKKIAKIGLHNGSTTWTDKDTLTSKPSKYDCKTNGK